MRCMFCKRPLEQEADTTLFSGRRACQSCSSKAVQVQIYEGDTLLETVYRVPVKKGNYEAVTYKGRRHKFTDTNGHVRCVQIKTKDF